MGLTLHNYQRKGVGFGVRKLFTEGIPGVGYFMDPGLGKTATTLHLIDQLRFLGLVRRVLIIAPLNVVYETWPDEIRQWALGFDWEIIHGSEKQRQRSLTTDCDIHLINPEGVQWLEKQKRRPAWDLVVIDESTKFKNFTGKRSRALHKILKTVPKRLILTGDPSANSEKDLHGQVFLIDKGASLGATKTYFQNKYCRQGGFCNREWLIDEGAGAKIMDAIAPIVYRLKAEDHLELPELRFNELKVTLPPAIAKAYRQIEKELFALLDDGETLAATSAGAKYALCQSIANGGAYVTDEFGESKRAIHVHDSKVDVIADLAESLYGRPLLVAYQYDHDLERLRRRFKNAPVICGKQKMAALNPEGYDTKAIIADWNSSKIPILLAQPAAMSHGLNMQKGGCRDIVWLGLTNIPEEFNQLNRRVYRQGVKGSRITVHVCLATSTVDGQKWRRLTDKSERQKTLLESLNEYRRLKHDNHKP